MEKKTLFSFILDALTIVAGTLVKIFKKKKKSKEVNDKMGIDDKEL